MSLQDHQLRFIELALARAALRFGTFTLKSGRQSPYFFNAGAFCDGEAARVLGQCYAAAVLAAGIEFDVLFGPAYKGIPLVTATAVALAEHHGRSVPYAFDRKETKDHGEGGALVGAPLRGRVLIIDDVLTAGTAVRQSIALIRRSGGNPVAVALALDREERGAGGACSAVQELEQLEKVRCVSIVTLSSLIQALRTPAASQPRISAAQLAALESYRKEFGIR